ncbi:MAG TPA: hypothetical protein VE988_25285 [Gemmataceae bacterium]|nr:hypothetical protein [Gemmataceae bacterium]
MTELEWNEGNEPVWMLDHLRQQNASQRKIRLFTCARARHFWHLLTDVRSRNAIEVGERFADGRALEAELNAAGEAAFEAAEVGQNAHTPSAWVAVCAAAPTDRTDGEGFWAVAWDFLAGSSPAEQDAMEAASSNEENLIRDIFGNPFRPRLYNQLWSTPTVVALAREIYEERAFDQLPILAVALQDAGCKTAEMLDHCRSAGPHVRGCWVVDLVLGLA